MTAIAERCQKCGAEIWADASGCLSCGAVRGDLVPPPSPIVRPPFVPGHFPAMRAEHYHAIEAMSASGAKKILKTPKHFRVSRDKPSKPTEPMQFGTAVHTAVMEPDLFSSVVAIAPEINRRTALGKAMWAECQALNAGKIILEPDEAIRVQLCAAAVRRHPAVAMLLAADAVGIEDSLFWEDGKYKVPCKSRLDIRSNGGVVDLKTTKDASPEEFAKDAAKYLYHVQAAMNFSGCEHVLNATPEFFAHIAAETDEPFCVAVYMMPSNAILAGAHLLNIALERYAEALFSGEWKGYPTTFEILPFPRWALRFG